MNRAVFLDRDGVLNRNIWNPATAAYESPLKPEQFELLPDVIPALQVLRDVGFLLFLVSNQPNYATGKASMSMLGAIHGRLEAALADATIQFAAYYYCFHHPAFTGECICRKPLPYFLLRARDTFGVELTQSWMVGDRPSDIQCGRTAGARTVEISDRTASTSGADRIAPDLWSASQIIVSDQVESTASSFRAII